MPNAGRACPSCIKIASVTTLREWISRSLVVQVLSIVPFTLLFASEPQPPKLDFKMEDGECIKFAKSFQKAVEKGEVKKVEELIAWETMIDSAIDGIEVNQRTRQNFKDDYLRDAGQFRSSFVGSLMNAGPRFEFLHIRRANGKPRLLFRTLRGKEVDYDELMIFRNASGAVQAFDASLFFTGENNTDWLRRLFLLSSPNARIKGRH